MNERMEEEAGPSQQGGVPCCISHKFCRVAHENPNKIALVHAIGGICSMDKNMEELFPSPSASQLSDFPPVFQGDVVYTFSRLLSAVNSLAERISNILSGSEDPDLIRHPLSDKCPMSYHVPDLIGIYIAPSPEYVVAVLAVLRSGRVFLPIDPLLPLKRVLMILSTSKVKLLLSSHHTLRVYSDGVSVQSWLVESDTSFVLTLSDEYCKSMSGIGKLICDLVWPCQSNSQRSYCYIMYTSGSSGKPKGVCGTEKGLLNRLTWMETTYPSQVSDISCFKTSISFVDHLTEILGALVTSTVMIIPPFKMLKENPLVLLNVLQVYHITRITAVPSLICSLLPFLDSPSGKTVKKFVRILILSGETFSIDLWKSLDERLTGTTILNLYGATELSGDCAYFDCKRLPELLEKEELHSVPIGKPIPGCTMILSKEKDVLQVSETEGEIWVGGDCCATKYLNDSFNNSSRFISLRYTCEGYNVSSNSENGCMTFYKTGDFAKKLSDGSYVFIGRKDRLVKVNGQRVVLEEIEYHLRAHPLVDVAAVSFSYEKTQIEAYIVLKGPNIFVEQNVNKKDHLNVPLMNIRKSLREWLAERLPTVMIPGIFSFLSSMPLLPSGKINFESLSQYQLHETELEEESEEKARDEIEIGFIQKVFSSVLMANKIEHDQDFFSLGGNSVSAAHAAQKMGVDMHTIYLYPTPQKLHSILNNPTFSVSLQHTVLHASKSFKEHKIMPQAMTSARPKKKLRTTAAYSTVVDKVSDKLQSFIHGLPEAVALTRCNIATHKEPRNHINDYHVHTNLRIFCSADMKLTWKVSLHACVDASPLLVKQYAKCYMFIGSHAHNFLCIDVTSGMIMWETELGGRVESTATITADFSQVVVGCYDGAIYFLDFHSGEILWSFQTNAEVKAQPIVDFSRGFIWCGSHDHHIYALDPQTKTCMFKLACEGSIFGAPAYDKERKKLYFATTSGSVTAINITDSVITVPWSHQCGSPIFGSPAVEYSTGYVICSMVNGNVIALSSSGSCVWQVSTGGPIFAGPCISSSLFLQVIVSSRDGVLYAFDARDGKCLWKHLLGEPITSSAHIDDQIEFIHADQPHTIYRLLCVCSSSGNISVIKVNSNAADIISSECKDKDCSYETLEACIDSLEGCQDEVSTEKHAAHHTLVTEYAKLDLPGEIFSSPVMVRGHIFVGCRDDNVYCVNLDLIS